MRAYLDLLKDIKKNGNYREDRTGVGTYSVFGRQMRFDLKESFPLLTSKKVFFKSLAYELIWMMRGITDNRWLNKHGVHIWDEWADKSGRLGPIYGESWRHFSADRIEATVIDDDKEFHEGIVYDGEYVDQLNEVVCSLKNDPFSRRHIVCAWNPLQLDFMALPPCHAFFQFWVRKHDGDFYLSCQLYQRSCDVFLGLPFNIASYSLLTYIIADCLGYKPDEFIWTGGDVHLYSNHLEQVNQQLSREPYRLPKLELVGHHTYPWEYEFEDFKLINYTCHPFIPAPIAV